MCRNVEGDAPEPCEDFDPRPPPFCPPFDGCALEGDAFELLSSNVAVGGQLISVRGLAGTYSDLFVPLFGEFQGHNAALAIAAVESFLGDGSQALVGDVLAEGLRLLQARESLRDEVARGFAQLDAGQGIPAEQVYARVEERISQIERGER